MRAFRLALAVAAAVTLIVLLVTESDDALPLFVLVVIPLAVVLDWLERRHSGGGASR